MKSFCLTLFCNQRRPLRNSQMIKCQIIFHLLKKRGLFEAWNSSELALIQAFNFGRDETRKTEKQRIELFDTCISRVALTSSASHCICTICIWTASTITSHTFIDIFTRCSITSISRFTSAHSWARRVRAHCIDVTTSIWCHTIVNIVAIKTVS